MKKLWRGKNPIDISGLIHVIQPVDQVEKRESCGKYYPWPSIDGVHVCKVRDFNFELGWASAQPRFLGMCVPVYAVAALRPCCALFTILDPRVIEHHWSGVSSLADAGGDLVPGHLIVDLQSGQKDISLGVHLQAETILVTTFFFNSINPTVLYLIRKFLRPWSILVRL